ncbi:MAG TPA: hypothetical protein VF486_28520 [Actinomycetes bacterium]
MSRTLAAPVGLVLLLWLLGGRIGLFIGLAIAVVDWFLRPPPTLFLRASLLGFCLLPVAVVIRGLPRPSTVTPLFAGSNLVAHYLAGTALALLVLGILRDVRPAPILRGPGNGPPPNGYEPKPLPSPPVQERLPAPDGASSAGNGAREAQPALPSATHPPLWKPGRRPGAAAAPPPKEAPPIHPPLWDPARNRPPPGATTAGGPVEHPVEPPVEPIREAPPTHPPLRDPARGPRPTGPTEVTGPAAPTGATGTGAAEPSDEATSPPAERPAVLEQAEDRPGGEGRRHPPELRIAGEPLWTEAGRGEAAAQDEERRSREREGDGGSVAPSDRREDSPASESPPTPERGQEPER